MQERERNEYADVFVLDVLEEFELAVGALGEDRRAEGFHDLLDGDGCTRKLVFCGTEQGGIRKEENVEMRVAYHTRPKAPLAGFSKEQGGMKRQARGMTHPCRRVGDRHILW